MKKWILFFIVFTIDLSGVHAQWTDNPLVNTAIATLTGDETVPHIAAAADGTYYMAWYSNESGNYNVRLQHLDSEGNELFETGGMLVSDNMQNSWVADFDLATDSESNAIVAFGDVRNGNTDIFAYKITPDGTMLWGENGIDLSNDANSEDEYQATICLTTNDHAIVAWSAVDNTKNYIRLQSIEPDGTLNWGNAGIAYSSETEDYTAPQLVASADGDFILAFYKQTGSPWAPIRHIYAQRFQETGDIAWVDDILVSDLGGISGWTNLNIKSDNNDGLFIAWHADIDGDMLNNAMLHHIAADASTSWPDNGLEIVQQENFNHFNMQIAGSNDNGNCYVFWHKTNGNQDMFALMAQAVDANANLLWENTGLELSSMGNNSVLCSGAAIHDNQVFLVYSENISGSNNSLIKALALDENGEYLWQDEHLNVSSAESGKMHYEVSGIYNNQLVTIWSDDRNGSSGNIYAQNINLDGTLGITTTLNDDATLSDLQADGTTIEGFSPSTLSYSVYLPEGTTTVPETTATPNDPNATVEITDATTLPGTTSILVTAEDGTTQLTYEITFSVMVSVDNTLKSRIQIYPLPASESLIISGCNNCFVEISSSNGQKIAAFEPKSMRINYDISHLPEGIYYLTVSDGQQKATVVVPVVK